MTKLLLLFLTALLSIPATAMTCASMTEPAYLAHELDDMTGRVTQTGYRSEVLRRERVRLQLALRAIERRPTAEHDFDNTLGAFDRALSRYGSIVSWLMFLSRSGLEVDKDETVRMIGESSKLFSALYKNEGLFAALTHVEPRTPEQTALRDIVAKEFRDAGVGRTPDVLRRATALEEEAAQLKHQFNERLRTADSLERFTRAELSGLDDELLVSLPREDELYAVNVGDPRFRAAILTSAVNEDTRRRAYLKAFGRARGNLDILGRLYQINDELARVLQNKSYLDSRIDETTLPRNAGNVRALLADLNRALETPRNARLASMQASKGAALAPWDIQFYDAKLMSGHADISEYLPADQTPARVIAELGRLFGLEFRVVEGAKLWHESVTAYDVFDTRAGDRPVSRVYIDAYARPGKATGQAYVSAFATPHGHGPQFRAGAAILFTDIASWDARGSQGIPREKLSSFLHEMGHLLNAIFGRPLYAHLSPMSFCMEYVETPSSIAERLVEYPGFMARISGRRGDGARVPAELVRMPREYSFTASPFYHRITLLDRLMLTDLDLGINTGGDAMAEYRRAFANYYGIQTVEEDRFPEIFHHQPSHYAGIFYSYIWAIVTAANVIPRIDAHGGLDQPAGAAYFRDHVLTQTRERAPADILDAVVGGPVKAAPVLELMGVGEVTKSGRPAEN